MQQSGCAWAFSSEKMKFYHDHKWGRPEHDDDELFAMLILEGAQAGLSWSTILDREENYRKAFDGLKPEIVAGYDAAKIKELLLDPGIIRNRRKVASAVTNAQAFLKLQEAFGSFDRYLWGFTDGKTIDNHPKTPEEIPAETELSKRISKDMKKRGFTFVGPTIIYAYMQSIGMVNDHLANCPCREEG
ncbi:MAG: DNA-3-methyladenine glycosylase I [Eubacteriales bacterium]|nr:DNA-3-methyladenine glycosylase I [Eubacteriales bacterium]